MNFSNKLLILLRGYETSYQGISKHRVCKIRFKVHQIPIVIKNTIFHLMIYIRLHLFLINSYLNITNSWEKSLSSLQKTNKTGPVCFLWKPDLNVNVWKLKIFAYICQNLYIYTQWKCVTTDLYDFPNTYKTDRKDISI